MFGGSKGKHSGVGLYLQQFRGMFVKRAIHTWRNRLVSGVQLLMPFIFAVIACLIAKLVSNLEKEAPPLTLDINTYANQWVNASFRIEYLR